MLSAQDHATIVNELVDWMTGELTDRGVDGEKVVVRGYYNLDMNEATLVVNEVSGARTSRRRTVPDRTIARATVSDEFARGGRPSEGPQAISSIIRQLRAYAEHVLLPVSATQAVAPEESLPPPSLEAQERARQIAEESLARLAQRGPQPSRRRDDGSGTSSRTTGSS